MRTHRTALVLPALASVALLALTGCSASGASDAPVADAASVITVDDPWVKAAEDGMTSSFGLLENTGEEDVTLVAVESSVSEDIELHQTSDDGSGSMSMEEKEGGFDIAAGDALELAPGGDHIMFMDFDGPLSAGDSVDITLIFSDDSRLEYDAAIRDFAGADESYSDDEDHGDHGDHDDYGDHDDETDHDENAHAGREGDGGLGGGGQS